MFITIPLKADLRSLNTPFITYTIIILCIFIYYTQQNNRDIITHAVSSYCQKTHNAKTDTSEIEIFQVNTEDCHTTLYYLYTHPKITLKQYYEEFLNGSDKSVGLTQDRFTTVAKNHLEDLARIAPRSLDSRIVYYPSSWNPVAMLTSALAHADFLHILGNLLFFFAFAPAVEALVGNRLHYFVTMVAIALICGISYSAISLSDSIPIPTLGLSGVVMGIIGLSAYLMPHVRIKTLFWILTFWHIIPIPVWILASWYIGWDIYYLFSNAGNSGINFMAHVSGGLGGYIIGMFWFKKRRAEIEEELEEEIDYMKHERLDQFGILSSHRGKLTQRRMAQEQQNYLARREDGVYMERLYTFVQAGKDSDAIIMLLQDYDHKIQSIEIYESIFDEMSNWRRGRAYLCLGRLLIDNYLVNKKYARAMRVAHACIEVDEHFLLANPATLPFFVQECLQQNECQLARQLIKYWNTRYGSNVSNNLMEELEMRIFSSSG